MSPPTPALVVDPAALDANLAAMQGRCDAAGVALRPHVKGHKCPWIAARQLRAGARGLAVATLEEARGLLGAGLGEDLLLTSVAPPTSAGEIVALQRLGRLAVVADDPLPVRALAERAREGGVAVPVLVDVDVGQGRAGTRGPEHAVAVADAIAESDGLVLGGVQAYEGHLQLSADAERRAGHARAMERLQATLDALAAAGHRIALVTSAGTGTAALAATPGGPVTEVQPGSYALMDASYARAAGEAFAQAIHVHTAVRTVLSADAVVVDAGLKAVSVDMGPAAVADRDASYEHAGDEHGIVRGDVGGLVPGSIVRLVPAHTDTTIRLHRRLWVDDAAVELV
jgi:D-serine deaminase-like pyridoxal phosphate-dependent protein